MALDVETEVEPWLVRSFCIVGVGYLFPFSALFQAYDFWFWLFGRNIEFELNLTFWVVNIVVLFTVVGLLADWSLQTRVYIGFCTQILCLPALPAVAFLRNVVSTNVLLTCVLCTTGLLSAGTALLDSSVIPYAAKYNSEVQQALQIGVGYSTLLGAVFRDVSKLSFTSKEVFSSTILHFALGIAALVVCLLTFVKIQRYTARSKCDISNDPIANGNDLEEALLLQEGRSSMFEVGMKHYGSLLSLVVLFVQSLTVWPSMVASLKGHYFKSLNEAQWYPILLLSWFAVMDVTGRQLSHLQSRFFDLYTIPLWLILRSLVIPAMVMCVLPGYLKVGALASDLIAIAIVTIVGFTNGQWGSAIILQTNKLAKKEDLKYIGQLQATFLNLGLLLGSILGAVIGQYLHLNVVE
eukprot:Platyproteum_vivax@DN1752_c0_g1_i1.p1